MNTQTIKAAIKEAGGVIHVAENHGISRISVYEWITNGRLPSDRVLSVAEMTGWRFTPHQLAPDLYPNPTDGLPPGVNPPQVPNESIIERSS